MGGISQVGGKEGGLPVPLLHAYVNAFKENLIENGNCIATIGYSFNYFLLW